MNFAEYADGALKIARKYGLQVFLTVDPTSGECSFESQAQTMPAIPSRAWSELTEYRKKNWGHK